MNHLTLSGAVSVLRQLLVAFLVFLQVFTPLAWRTFLYRSFGVHAGSVLSMGASFATGSLIIRQMIADAQAQDGSQPPPLSEAQQQEQQYLRALVPKPEDLVRQDGQGSLLFLPNSQAPISESTGRYTGASNSRPQDDATAYEGDNGRIISQAYTESETLDNETPGSGSGLGEAYRLVKGSKNHAHPDLRNDPILRQSGSILANRGEFASTFGNCSTTRQRTETSSSNHVPDYRMCERVNAKSGQETLFHDYSVLPPVTITARGGERREQNYTCDRNGENCRYTPNVFPIDSQSGVRSCGSGCLDVFLGQVGDNYLPGDCTVYEQNLELNLPVPNAITQATLTYTMWDDYFQVLVNDRTVFNGPDGNFPPETAGRCERKTQFSASPNTDLTSDFRTSSAINIKTRVSVTGKGEGYAVLRLLYNTAALIQDRGYTPPQAANLASAAGDSQCKNSQITPTRSPAIDGGNCAVVNDIRVCPEDFPPPPNPQINPLWQEMSVSLNCNPSYGTYCWRDINGQDRCYTQDENNSDGSNCERFEENPGCAFVSSKCLEGATGESGACYVTEEKWDCGFSTTTTSYSLNDVTTCDGAIQCIGESCIRQDRESSNDFASATAAMSAVKMIATDSECRPDGKCYVFPGSHYNCKNAVGGIQNCCEGGTPPSLVQYLLLYEAGTQVTAAIGQLEVAQPIYGAWSSVSAQASETFSQYWSEIRKPFASIMDNIAGSTVESTTNAVGEKIATQTFMDQLKQELMAKSYELISEQFGPEVANALLQKTGEGALAEYALSDGMATAANFAGYIMAAYTAYQMTLLLISIVWACEAAELELNAKRQLKVCTHLGSYCKTKVVGACIEKREVYCCYNSPLSRIMMEQINPQLNRPYGSLKNPDCTGLSIEEVQNVDFTKVDLSEWIALLTLAGALPDAQGNTAKDYSLEAMTGQGSPFDTSASTGVVRANAAERSVDRVQNADVSNTRTQAQQQFYHGDPADAEPDAQSSNPYGDTGTPPDYGAGPKPEGHDAQYYPRIYSGGSQPDNDVPASDRPPPVTSGPDPNTYDNCGYNGIPCN